MLGLEGRKDVVGRKAGGGEVNMTPWFIVLSCHRAARIRSFFSFFFCSFSFLQGRGGYGRGGTIADAVMAASSAKSLQGLIQIN